MRKAVILIHLLFVFQFHVLAQNDTTINLQVNCASGEWELVFSEEFNDTTLNHDRWLTWFPYSDDGSDQCAFCRTHGKEGQIYRDENVEPGNGVLRFVAKREQGSWLGEQRAYSSGMIHSRQSFGIGKYEIRCRLPVGHGFWPAIWAYGRTTSELDILEAGMQHPYRYHMSIHNRKIKKMLHRRHCGFKNLSSGFHTFAMEWDTNFIRFSIDSLVVWRITPYRSVLGCRIKKCSLRPGRYLTEPVFPPSDETLHLILNLAVGNDQTPFTGSPDEETIFPAQMEIDWIRYYKRKPGSE